jgi:phenylalanyl-tRNA synthetase alpha chain
MSGVDEIKDHLADALSAVRSAVSQKELDDIAVRFIGRKGLITSILKSLKELPIEQRKTVGAAANKAKAELELEIKAAAEKYISGPERQVVDPTLPGVAHRVGATHPITKVIDRMCQSFHGMGFTIARGPEVETDYYNFEALNFPPDHPARDMQDTFYVEGDGLLLRTHTTPVQARVLEKCKPPVKVITPGRCYRNEEISTRSYCVFHQVDGFYLDTGVTMADLKGVLVAFCRDFFGEGVKLRFRPSYFPFTEPSAELDISCILCGGRGCQLCKYTGWLEILGCGMIDPNVLITAGHDPEVYSGYAFGIGVERIILLKYSINDIRLFYENDIRFIRQFK